MQSQQSQFRYDDGGRAAAGYLGKTGDCVTRAIAIATGKSYDEVYRAINKRAGKPIARKGVGREVYEPYLAELGWKWVPTMRVGQGCTTHLNAQVLPLGRLIVRVSKHMVAMLDGVVHDSYNSTIGGQR
jgi:hypothetical protein